MILSAARTPITSFQGSLSSMSGPELGAVAVRAAVERSGVAIEDVDESILGNVVSAGAGQACCPMLSLPPNRMSGIS